MELILTNWPVLLMMVWTVYRISKAAARQDEPVTYTLFNSLMLTLLEALVLTCGGFFTFFGWPQWSYIVASLIGLGILSKGEFKSKVSVGEIILQFVAAWIIFYCGGFWFH